MSNMGLRIRKYRTERGLTQDQLAARLHVTRQAVSNWETGKNQPDLDMLEELARSLETDLPALIGAGEPVYPRYQKKAVVWVAVLGFLTLFLLLNGLLLSPYLLKLRARTFNIWPDLLNGLVVMPVLFLAAGMLIPAAVSLWRNVKPKGRSQIVLRSLSVLLLLPMLLVWLGLLWPKVYPAALFILMDPTRFRWHLAQRVFPFLAGLCLFPAWS